MSAGSGAWTWAKQRALATNAELGMVVIDQLAQFTGIRAAETLLLILYNTICSLPKPSGFCAAALLEQFGLIGLPVLLVLDLLAPGEQLASAIEQIPLTHQNRMDGG
jgi:hypothetical protein